MFSLDSFEQNVAQQAPTFATPIAGSTPCKIDIPAPKKNQK